MDSEAYKHRDYLSLLGKKQSARRRNLLIDYANAGEVKAICECVRNVLNGNVQLTKRDYLKMKRYKKTMRDLNNKRLASARKKRILHQKGGILPLLLSPALDLLGGLIKKVF